MRPRGSPYPSVHANMSIINVYTATPLRVHPAGSCVSSMMIPVRPDLLIVGLGHCPSPAQFDAASPFRAISGEAELECVLRQTPSDGSAEYGADLPRPRLRMQAWSQCTSLRFFLQRYLHAIRRTVGPCVGSAGHSCHQAHRRVRLRRKL